MKCKAVWKLCLDSAAKKINVVLKSSPGLCVCVGMCVNVHVCKCVRVCACVCSSEYSEGEWSASLTSDSGLEKERRSSEESWETLPGLDELRSSSSSLEDIPPLNLTQE